MEKYYCSAVSILPVILAAFVCLIIAPPAFSRALPDVAQGKRVILDRAGADTVVTKVFGLNAEIDRESSEYFRYRVESFIDSRRCPLDKIRGLNCVGLDWKPSAITVYRQAWDGPVSGHLSRNRVVMVDMESESVGFAIGTMHGVLVMPSAGYSKKRRASFGWYLSRSGRSMSISLKDVSRDGVADVVYTYSQVFPRGLAVAVQDVWTFNRMAASKYISSGEKLSGVLSSTFEGVPVFFGSDDRVEVGRFIYGSGGRGVPDGSGPPVVVVERTLSSDQGLSRSWELQVVADMGTGWVDYLAVQGSPTDVTTTGDRAPAPGDRAADGFDAPEGDMCTILDLPVPVRRFLLDIEDICRTANQAGPIDNVLLITADRIIRGFSLGVRGFPVLASAFFESAAVELAVSGRYFFAGLVSWFAALAAQVSIDSVCAAGCDDSIISCEHDYMAGELVSGFVFSGERFFRFVDLWLSGNGPGSPDQEARRD